MFCDLCDMSCVTTYLLHTVGRPKGVSAKMRRRRIICHRRNRYLRYGKYMSTYFKKESRTEKLVSKTTCEFDSTHRVLIFTRKKWQITRRSTSQYFKKANRLSLRSKENRRKKLALFSYLQVSKERKSLDLRQYSST